MEREGELEWQLDQGHCARLTMATKVLFPLFSWCLLHSSLAGAIAVQSQSSQNSNIDLTSPMILPGLDNLTVPLTALFNISLDAVDPPVTCYAQTVLPTIARREPVDLIDCLIFFPIFILRPNVMDSVRWGSTDLPKSYTFKSCQMTLSAKALNARDTFQEVMILQRAAMILRACLQGRDPDLRYGGKVSVGSRGLFWVSINHP